MVGRERARLGQREGDPVTLVVRDVSFTPATEDHVDAGLLGWISFAVGDLLRLDGVTLRRTRDGRLALGYPARESAGRKHPYMRPFDDRARRLLEQQVLGALGLGDDQ